MFEIGLNVAPRLSRCIMSAEDEGSAGGGGGGDDKPLSRKDVEGMIADVVGKTVNGRIKALNQDLDKRFQTFEEKLGGTISEQLKPLLERTEEKKGGDGGTKVPPEVQKQLDAMKAANDALTKKLNDAEQAKKAEHEKAQRTEERSRLTQGLADAGIDKGRLGHAVAWLYSEGQKVGRDDKGEIVFKGVLKDGIEQDVPLAEGIKYWMTTDDAKHFQPAQNAGGSGAKGGRGTAAAVGAGGKLTDDGWASFVAQKAGGGQ